MASKKKRKKIRVNSHPLHKWEGKTIIRGNKKVNLIKRNNKGMWNVEVEPPYGPYWLPDNMSDEEVLNSIMTI